jgi:hypothetical protein
MYAAAIPSAEEDVSWSANSFAPAAMRGATVLFTCCTTKQFHRFRPDSQESLSVSRVNIIGIDERVVTST